MPRAITIGKLRYDIVADTSSFVNGVKGTTKQLRSLERDFKRTRTPLERFQMEMTRINRLYGEGAIDMETGRRLLNRANRERWRAVDAQTAEARGAERTARANDNYARSIRNVNAARGGGGGRGGRGTMSRMPGNIGGAMGSLMGGARMGAAGRLMGHGASASVGSMGGAIGLGAATVGVGLAAGAVAAVGKATVEFAKFEKEVVDLQSIVGKSVGGEMVESFRQVARETVLTTSQLTKGAKTWVQYGNTVDRIVPIMEAVGAISGGDSTKMNDMIVALSQIESQGKLMGQEKMQLVNAGFSLKGIAQVGGFDMSEFADKLEAGEISAKMVMDAAIMMASEGEIFGSRLEDNASTVAGKWGILLNEVTETFINLGETMGDDIKMVLDGSIYVLKKYQAWQNLLNEKGEEGKNDNWWNRRKDDMYAMWNGTSAEDEAQKRILRVLNKQAKAMGFKDHAARRIAAAAEKEAKAQEDVADSMTDQQKAQQAIDRASLAAKEALELSTDDMIQKILKLENENRIAKGGKDYTFSGPKFLQDRLDRAQADKDAREAKAERDKANNAARVNAAQEAGKAKQDLIKERAKTQKDFVNNFFDRWGEQAKNGNASVNVSGGGGADYAYVQQRQQRQREFTMKQRLDNLRNQKLQQIETATKQRAAAAKVQNDRLVNTIKESGV